MASHAAHKRIELSATAREVIGDKVRHLRTDGVIPAVVYGKGQEALNLQVPLKDFEATLKLAGESTLVYLKVGGTEYPTIINEVARHPGTGAILHADFYKVNLNEKIKAMVPVVFVGESAAVKSLGGIFVRNINELEVEALPTNLPHEIEVDISKLVNLEDRITLADISMADVAFVGDKEEVLATVQTPKSEAELEAELAEPTTDVSTVEEIKKEKPEGEEGETAAGEAPAAPAEESK